MAGKNGDRKRDDDLTREIGAHLELDAEERVAEGASPEEARLAARRAFGNVTRVREDARAIWTMPRVDQAVQDVRYGLRMFGRAPGFSAIALLTLALGIGATTAIFSVVNAILLRPLPFKYSDRIVRISENIPPAGGTVGMPRRVGPLRASDLPALRTKSTTLSHVGVHIPTIRTVTSLDGPVRLIGVRLSPDLLAMLETPPLIGRIFHAHEDAPGADAVVILSFAAWQRHFGGDRGLVGRTIALDGRPYTVVGVMDQSFAFPSAQDEFWMPLARAGPLMNQRLALTARLKDGMSIAAAHAEISAIVPALRNEPQVQAAAATFPRFELATLRQLVVTPVKPALFMLSAAVGFVLLIACANVANLLLTRATARRREYAVRLALGAGRARLIRQALAESTLLALAGGVAGTALGFGGVRLLRLLGAPLPRRDLGSAINIPRLDEVAVDGSVLMFALAVATVTGITCGLVPALRREGTPADVLRQGSAPISGFNLFSSHRTQGVLVAVQIALAVVLFVGGALLIQSFLKLVSVNPGYEARLVSTFELSLAPGRPDHHLRLLADQLVANLEARPGVRSAGYAEGLPMTQVSARPTRLTTTPRQTGSQPAPLVRAFTPDNPDARLVSRDFLAALNVPVIEGRGFSDHDGLNAPRAMLINRTLARSAFVGDKPIGKRFYALGPEPWEIVGIVEDVRQTSLAEPPAPQIFVDFRQIPPSEPLAGVGLYFAMRTDAASGATATEIRRIARELDPQLMVEHVAPMDALVSNSVARPRLYAVVLGVFAAVALALAAVGIYGVISYAVAQRAREIGIRMALGGTGAQVAWLVLRQSAVLIGAGVVAGLAGASALTRYLDQLLFGLTALDPATYIAVAIGFGIIATVATLIPTRRAMRVDPRVTLRTE